MNEETLNKAVQEYIEAQTIEASEIVKKYGIEISELHKAVARYLAEAYSQELAE